MTGDPLLDRLVAFKRKKKHAWFKVAEELGRNRLTVGRWVKDGRIPNRMRAPVAKYLGLDEPPPIEIKTGKGPRDLLLLVQSRKKRDRKSVRCALGYAAMWLYTEIEAELQQPVRIQLPALKEKDRTAVQVVAPNGLVTRVVYFSLLAGELCYECKSLNSTGGFFLELEGSADALGFDFCKEFLLEAKNAGELRGLALAKKRLIEIHKHV